MKKDQKTDIDGMIMGAHYLHALDKESLASRPLSEMECQDFINLLQSKDEMIAQFKDMIASLEKVLDADAAEKSKLLDQIAKLTAEVAKLSMTTINVITSSPLERRVNPAVSKMLSRAVKRKRMTTMEQLVLCHWRLSLTRLRLRHPKELTRPRLLANLWIRDAILGVLTQRWMLPEILESRTDLIPPGMRVIGFKDEDEFTRESYVKCTSYRLVLLEDEFGVRHELFIPKNPHDHRRPKANVINGTHCTPEFLASLAMDRFQLHLPVYREAIRLTNEKMSICRQTVSNWLGKGSALLQNLLPCLKRLLLKAKSVLNIDETWCRVRIVNEEFENGKYFKKYKADSYLS